MSSSSPSSGARPRSAALVGPLGSGKSTLFDALLAAAGAGGRRTDPRARRAGTELRLGHCGFMGDAWSLLDCPGSVEFAYETECALAVADIAVVVCDPSPARAAATAPILRVLDREKIPHMLFINRMDTIEGRVRDTIATLQAHSAAPLVLRQVPIRQPGQPPSGYVDLVSARAYRYRPGQASELVQVPEEVRDREAEGRAVLLETLADHDDALLEKLLEDVTPTPAEIYAQLKADIAADLLVEVLLGAAERGAGVQRLWKALRHDTPDAAATALRKGIAPEGPPLAQVFRTVHAGHAGKLSLSRVWRGVVRDGASLSGQRVGGISRFQAGEAVKGAEAAAGELVGLGRLEAAVTGAALGEDLPLDFPTPPPPVYALAVATQERGDDVKLSAALAKLVEEDPALSVTHEKQTGETVLHGQGEIHLNAALERLAKGFNLRLASHRPAVPFKETIRAAVHEHARLKRQTGGHGQFADVKLDIAPRGRGEGFAFVDRIVGGAVPRQFIPAVGDAAEEAARTGPLGHPVVDISVTLVDGTFHSVDSSDMAFRTATRMAMQEGLAKASPVLLEPIDHVTVRVPSEHTASAQRLLTGRRGRILGYAALPDHEGWDAVEAMVPEAELHDLIIELRSQTAGLGTYVHRFDHLAETEARK